MTIVAGFGIKNIPVILSDLLISGEENVDRDFRIPTIGWRTNVFPEGSGYVPIYLLQKISIINKDVAIAWAGTKIYAQNILRELKKLSEKECLSKEYLVDYFNKLNREDKSLINDIQFYGLVANPVGISSFWFGGCYFHSRNLGRVTLLGSGYKDIYEYFQSNEELPEQNPKMNDAEYALSYSLSLTGAMLLSEIKFRGNILRYFGGGYQIVMFNDGEFQKIGDITFVFWNAKPNGKKVNLGLIKIIKLSYDNDLMLLQVISPGGDGPTYSISNANSGVYFIPPAEMTAPPDRNISISLPDINSIYTCHLFAHDTVGKHLDVVTIIDKVVPGEERHFNIDYTPQSVGISMDDSFWDRIRANIYQ